MNSVPLVGSGRNAIDCTSAVCRLHIEDISFRLTYRFIWEKAVAPHPSNLAWKFPWTEEPHRLQSSGVARSQTLSDFTFTFHFYALEKEMATHSSVLAWRIPGMGEPGGLLSMG